MPSPESKVRNQNYSYSKPDQVVFVTEVCKDQSWKDYVDTEELILKTSERNNGYDRHQKGNDRKHLADYCHPIELALGPHCTLG